MAFVIRGIVSICSVNEKRVFESSEVSKQLEIVGQVISPKKENQLLFDHIEDLTIFDDLEHLRYFSGRNREASPRVKGFQSILQSLHKEELIFYDQMQRSNSLRLLRFTDYRGLWQSNLAMFLDFIDIKKVNYVYLSNTPHELLSWTLYCAAKARNLRVFFFQENHNLGLKHLVSRLEDGWSSNTREPANLPEAIREWKISWQNFTKRENLRAETTPKYMEIFRNRENLRKRTRISFFNRVNHLRLLLKSAFNYGQENKSISAASASRFESFVLQIEWITAYLLRHFSDSSVRNEFMRLYKVPIDKMKRPCVVLFLNYLPEMSVNPISYPFLQHNLVIQELDEHLPENFTIYVREHPSQLLNAGGYGYLGRYPGFYKELLISQRVQFLDTESDWSAVINSCDLVATISGSIGWQAVLNDKRALIFGKTWYDRHPQICNSQQLRSNLIFEQRKENSIVNLDEYIASVFATGLCFTFTAEEAKLLGMPYVEEWTQECLEVCIFQSLQHNYVSKES